MSEGNGKELTQGQGTTPPAVIKRLVNIVSEAIGIETAHFAAQTEAESKNVAERLITRINHRELARQGNIERIVQMAISAIAPSEPKMPMDRGWLTRFFERAQDASHELERQLWAKILAREVEAPGRFAKRTLDFLDAMDFWELEGFIEYCAFSFNFESGWRFMFDDEIAHRTMWSYGREIDLTPHWIGIGLLSRETAILKPVSAKGLRIHYRDRAYEFRGTGTLAESGTHAESVLTYRKFTTTGQQLSEVIQAKAFFGYARNLIQALNSHHGISFDLVEEMQE